MSGTNKLSDRKLKALQGTHRDRVEMLADGEGLGVRLSTKGHVSWVFSYRLGGRESSVIRLTLGNYPDISLKDARMWRERCRQWLANGLDPKIELQLFTEESRAPVTVRDALEYWLVNYARHKRKDEELIRAQFCKHVYPRIGHYPLSRCDTRHWVKCFDEIRAISSKTAGCMFQLSKQALRFCNVRRYAISDALVHLTLTDVGESAGQRDRVLSDAELSDLWYFAKEKHRDIYFSRLIKLLIVFGARTVEIRRSHWIEWDFNEWVWIVPRNNSKSNKKIIRPIPEGIRDWLKELKQETGRTGLLLGEERTHRAVSLKGRRMYKIFGHNEKWTLHDLRRTFSTGLNNMGVMPYIVESLLGHVYNAGSAEFNYNLSQYIPFKLQALNDWFKRLELLDKQNIKQD
ncbi:site-specific integrase [Escherichia coli]|nr:site-specific integrase [Escherichia coli]